jgi:hypothetical protein
MDFDIENVRTIEFGVGRDDGDERVFHAVVVDDAVQGALQSMLVNTQTALTRQEQPPSLYAPSEKYASIEYVYLPLDDELAGLLRGLHSAANLDLDQQALSNPTTVFCYFARFIDTSGRRVTGVRRATQFKGILKSRLVRVLSDALKLVNEDVFRLDTDFDLLIDDERVHILRPSGFEFACMLQRAILDAVEGNVSRLRADLPYLDCASILRYAGKRPRAARYLASITSQQEVARIDRARLLDACAAAMVPVEEIDGEVKVAETSVLGFLEVLDRRRYEVNLVPDEPEKYRAPSRRLISR